ncbi:hypothetical protein KL905_003323 [Ogataea polymorpha]|uniref:Uncharacterized protein n=1 Tax=Ogataea polymorpha TaxID=460523 RepID=A0A1B7SMJ1_9ASCO|nr:uncharacterized protein OGAPODRAFT_23479 [Ogataea polymorpha]KAG7892343.1 hypothetical protein KL908_003295 [Ogataea polymorpha]KAG7900189.1 hypothetical protein KL935_002932 [Ogataea polymorpha]KAG7920689.1 hypothetical protein KL905_003323 [Ogataea polymorpha]KAG7935711.1 hypothetical protein KL934_002270 [Ogataea polymorpha]KAH3677794.1 hypothetical protein OGATHE_000448 [Ogataea polymorpha]
MYKSVCVIGGGACGLATVRGFLEEGGFEKVVGFEQRPSFGGIWNYHELADQNLSIPSVDPLAVVNPIKTETGYVWPNAVYDALETNTPYPLMEFRDFKFPESTPLFPHRSVVLDYISRYGEDLRQYYRFNTRIVEVRRRHKWIVRSRTVCDATAGGFKESASVPDTVEEYDAVMVATGVYDLPFIPELKGLRQWHKKYPNTILHSKTFRSPRELAGVEGNILVIGNSASGNDICYQFARYTGRNIYKSARSASRVPGGTSDLVIEMPDISHLDPNTASVFFAESKRLENVGCIIFATGFLRSLPFFAEINRSEKPLISDGSRIHGLYRHCWSYEHPGLAFIAISRYVLPFHVAEIQGIWLAKILRNKIFLPSFAAIASQERHLLSLRGNLPCFHDLLYPDDIEYMDLLMKDIRMASDSGRLPKEWTELEIALRKNTKLLKAKCLQHFERTGKRLTLHEALSWI